MHHRIAEAFHRLCAAAKIGEQSPQSWLQMRDAVAFLRENGQDEEFVVYGRAGLFFVHTVLAHRTLVEPPDVEDLLEWDFNATSAWSVSASGTEDTTVSKMAPLQSQTRTFQGAEQLVFARSFSGRLGQSHYVEVDQICTHILDLHYVSERLAYCRLDARGEVQKVITFIELPSEPDLSMVTFRRAQLELYAALNDFAIIRTFDFCRIDANFRGWSAGAGKIITDGDLSKSLFEK